MLSQPARVADIGELALLRDVLLPCVKQMSDSHGDDCARVDIANRRALWSIDPCPTPVAQLLGVCSPEVLGWYTALINLSDIAACGGTPRGLLVSLEMPGDTPVEFVKSFQRGLMTALARYDTPLLGGNVKSASRFAATGTVIGEEGARSVSRSTDADDCDAFLIGHCGSFWASVIGHSDGWGPLPISYREALTTALLNPTPKISAGKTLASLPYQVACMDCSDGPANALFQLAMTNSMDLIVPNQPDWNISHEASTLLSYHGASLENACYHFGDWQLACFVPHAEVAAFRSSLACEELTWIGRARRGRGRVTTADGRRLRTESLNENFRQGYNSISSIEELIDRYLLQPIFDTECAGN